MKCLFTLMLVVTMCLTATASNTEVTSELPSTTEVSYSLQVCQISLSSYTGTIKGSHTNNFCAQLNCPQDKDVSPTIFLYIDNKRVKSLIVTISAGSTSSGWTHFDVDEEYDGKQYELRVNN